MAFCFNFAKDSEDNDDNTDDILLEAPVSKKKKLEQFVTEFKEITVEDCKTDYPYDLEVNTYQLTDNITVSCYDAGAIEEILKKDKDHSSSVVKATSCHSDLVPNVYEGGLTVWECGIDLASYIAKEVDFTDKMVLELGSGAGIPGICAMVCGAKVVHFQDYNEEVLKEYTIPNVTQLNMDDDVKCTCRYFSGDWSQFSDKIDNEHRYDIILTAETIYNPDNYQKLHDVFTSQLDKHGTIYLAAKSNYFGVGGGTRLFEDFTNKKGQFSCKICKTIEAGVPREIMQLKWKDTKIDKLTEKT
ncbi:histidine protein methyltransferase 1 homolog [Mytilus edulis]|uniref:histidine protein methyltransferase 1 homolog n=1 Tax=Mytilus edulis TaxID=6550 RepID=UPI0039F045BE